MSRHFTLPSSVASDPSAGASSSNPLDRVRVVLVETSLARNVGSAARAMMTMGLTRLVLAAPKHTGMLQSADAVALASGAGVVLAQAREVPTLAEAIADCHLAVAFTARMRELSHPYLPLREAARVAMDETPSGEVALVFGNEAMCLSNDDVARCQLSAAIPANPVYSSLNLSQAVQVAAYEMMMSAQAFAPKPDHSRPLATVGDVDHLLAALEDAAIRSQFLDPDNPKRFDTRMRRLFTRAKLEREEVNILRGIIAALVKKH